MLTERATFSYDVNGNIVLEQEDRFVTPGLGTPSTTIYTTFEYGNGKFPIKITQTNSSTPTVTTSSYTYTDGNITQIISAQTNPNAGPSTSSLQYDDKPNPYYGLISLNLGGFNRSSFNKNNAIISGETFTYDTNGLLIELRSTKGPSFGEKYNYELY